MNYIRKILLIILISISLKAQWVKLDTTAQFDNRQVFFVNETTGYIIGVSGADLLKTTNGGQTWDVIRFDGYETSMYFINENIGFITAGLGLKKTTDGGLTWTTNSDANYYESIYFLNDKIGYAAGSTGKIGKTIDQGDNWQVLTFSEYPHLHSIYGIDSLTVYAFGYRGTGLKSTDGGNKWNQLDMGHGHRFVKSFFINSEIGYVIGWDLGASILIKTTDGGNSWELLLQSQIELSGIYFTDLNTGYLVGGYYLPNSLPILWKTTNGGSTWIDQNPESNVSDAIHSIQFVNDCVGYAVGENGLILKTVNAGDSTLCKEIPPPPVFKLNQNYPNPFNKQTIIEYEIPVDSNIELNIYNVLGEKVKTLVNQFQITGKKKVLWGGTDDKNKILSSGLYIYILKTNKHRYFKKLLFLK